MSSDLAPPGVVVRLSWAEFDMAAQVGLLRFTLAESARRGSNEGRERSRVWGLWLADHVLGACGELAYCKYLGRFWSGTVDTFHGGQADVGARTEVRTARRLDGPLIIRQTDPPDRAYVLVVGEPPELRVVGWIDGGSARLDAWWRDPGGLGRPVWCVPQSALRAAPQRR